MYTPHMHIAVLALAFRVPQNSNADVFQVELPAGTQLRDIRGISPTKEVLSEPRTLGATAAK